MRKKLKLKYAIFVGFLTIGVLAEQHHLGPIAAWHDGGHGAVSKGQNQKAAKRAAGIQPEYPENRGFFTLLISLTPASPACTPGCIKLTNVKYNAPYSSYVGPATYSVLHLAKVGFQLGTSNSAKLIVVVFM